MKNFKDIKKDSEIYKVPENYFESFQAKMSDMTAGNAAAPGFMVTYGKKLAYAIPVLLILLVAVFISTNEENNDPLLALTEISTVDLVNFLEEDGITESELISFLGDEYFDSDIEEMIELKDSYLLEGIDAEGLDNLSEELEEYL